MVIVTSLLNTLRQERGYRRTRSILHNMDDHRLQDIGVRRDQIDSLAFELREAERKRATADARKRRDEKRQGRTFGGHGLAPQH